MSNKELVMLIHGGTDVKLSLEALYLVPFSVGQVPSYEYFSLSVIPCSMFLARSLMSVQ